MSRAKYLSRRQFLRGTAAGIAAFAAGPSIIPASALGAGGLAAPSNRINVGLIGCGGQGLNDLGSCMWGGETQVVGVCEVDRNKRERGQRMVNQHYGERMKLGNYRGCSAYNDFRDLLARKDLDAVIVATPDHWHAIIAIEAAKAGCDIYCEKPLSLTIREARAMVNAVRRYGRILQTGSQQRSEYGGKFRFACELVRNGYVGTLHSVFVSVGGPSGDSYPPELPVPEGFDWDMWLGPAPYRPFSSITRGHAWRRCRDFSGGGMTDWGAHHFDIAQWGLGMDDSGPVEISPPDTEHRHLTYRYANGVFVYHVPLRKRHGPRPADEFVLGNDPGLRFVGDKGWVEVGREWLRTEPESLVRQTFGRNDIRLYRSVGHVRDWLRCIRNRRRPICDVEIGCRSATVCHLGNIAYWLDRPLRWDPVKEEILGDPEAARWLERPKRGPWRL